MKQKLISSVQNSIWPSETQYQAVWETKSDRLFLKMEHNGPGGWHGEGFHSTERGRLAHKQTMALYMMNLFKGFDVIP